MTASCCGLHCLCGCFGRQLKTVKELQCSYCSESNACRAEGTGRIDQGWYRYGEDSTDSR